VLQTLHLLSTNSVSACLVCVVGLITVRYSIAGGICNGKKSQIQHVWNLMVKNVSFSMAGMSYVKKYDSSHPKCVMVKTTSWNVYCPNGFSQVVRQFGPNRVGILLN
jgi:hypothetical protein